MKIKTTMRYHLTASEWLSSERTQITEYIYIWTGRPGMLQFMGSKRVGHDWATELNWSEICISKSLCCTEEINATL